ncbi:MAG: DUF2007 domain-containing protein [Marinobacter sp.]|nr:DUF2007 domain-containing protein [Marinobacter sp.]
MQIAYRAKDITEAHIVAGLLEAEGIETHVSGSFLQGAMGEIGTAGFSNVHVDDEDYYQARQLVEDYEASLQPEQRITHTDTQLNYHAHGFLLGLALLGLVLLALLGS